ncbi:MAG: peptidylprolyl isomerase [Bacteroidota bacterium]
MNLRSFKSQKGIALLILFISTGSIFAQQEVVVDEIIVKVDDYIVLKSDLEKAYLDVSSRGSFTQGNLKCRLLEQMVVDKLLVAKAEIDSVVVSEDEVQRNLDRRFQVLVSQVGSKEEIEAFYGKSIEEFQEELREQVEEQLIVQRMQGTITEGLDVTPAEVKKFFKNIPADSLPFFSKEVAVAQLVKFPEVSKPQKLKVKDRLLEIREQIKSDSDFEEMARKYSEDPGSAFRGGNYGFQTRGSFVPEYEAAVFKMEPGEISEPIESEFGYHLIQLIERRGNEYNSRHILLKIEPSEEDLEGTEDLLDSLKTTIEEGNLTFQKAASEYSDDIVTSGSGGFFAGSTGALSIPVDEIDPVLFFTLDTMSVGSITPPMRYRTDDGKDAVRVIYYKSFSPPHQANLNDDYQKIYSATLNSKRSKILNKWFDDARYDVYIDIDDEYSNCEILK